MCFALIKTRVSPGSFCMNKTWFKRILIFCLFFASLYANANQCRSLFEGKRYEEISNFEIIEDAKGKDDFVVSVIIGKKWYFLKGSHEVEHESRLTLQKANTIENKKAALEALGDYKKGGIFRIRPLSKLPGYAAGAGRASKEEIAQYTQVEISNYYDTPSRKLHKNKIAIRTSEVEAKTFKDEEGKKLMKVTFKISRFPENKIDVRDKFEIEFPMEKIDKNDPMKKQKEERQRERLLHIGKLLLKAKANIEVDNLENLGLVQTIRDEFDLTFNKNGNEVTVGFLSLDSSVAFVKTKDSMVEKQMPLAIEIEIFKEDMQVYNSNKNAINLFIERLLAHLKENNFEDSGITFDSKATTGLYNP